MEAAMPDDRPDAARPHVLAINDDSMVLALFRDLLEDDGFQVSTQTYIDKDVAGVVSLAPDVIIMDYMWPGDDNGWSYLQMLRMDPQTTDIPIVLCTGAVREVEAMGAHLAEMSVRVVLKPFNIDQLLDAVRAALDGA